MKPLERRPTSPANLAALADAIAAEVRLLNEVGSLLRLQRAAVATSDLERVEETVSNTHRVLMTLSQARRLRVGLAKLLEVCVGTPEQNPLRADFDALRRAALSVRDDVEISRLLLRQAMEGSEELIRMAYGTGAAVGGYERTSAPVSLGNRRDVMQLKMTA